MYSIKLHQIDIFRDILWTYTSIKSVISKNNILAWDNKWWKTYKISAPSSIILMVERESTCSIT